MINGRRRNGHIEHRGIVLNLAQTFVGGVALLHAAKAFLFVLCRSMRTKAGAAQRMEASETISKSADDVGHSLLGFGPLLLFWQLVWTDHGRSSDVRSRLDHFGVADCWRLQNSVALIKFFCEHPPIGAHTRSDAATLILRASSWVVGEC